MEHIPEATVRSLLQNNYDILESYSSELEMANVKEERIDEIFAQVKNIAVCSMQWLHNLITINSDPLQSESLESSLNYLQYAITEAQFSQPSRRKALKQVLYHSQMALLSYWSCWLIVLLGSS